MGQPAPTDLKARIAHWSYRLLHWGKDDVPPVLRSVVGVLLMCGGVLGFLPVLGFWMLPLGLAFIALDLPFAQPRIHAWLERLRTEAGLPPEEVVDDDQPG